jgi:hypothetical protein
MASYLEIDGVIDPADTRAWILRGLKSVPRVEEPPRRKRMNRSLVAQGRTFSDETKLVSSRSYSKWLVGGS